MLVLERSVATSLTHCGNNCFIIYVINSPGRYDKLINAILVFYADTKEEFHLYQQIRCLNSIFIRTF